MTQNKILDRLIQVLCAERSEAVSPLSEEQKPDFFRALCNVRPPMPVTEEFLRLQDEYLSQRTKERGIVDVNGLDYGCFHPLHNCIDNVIHSAAGIQVRLDCDKLMKGKWEPNGQVKVTKAYNLPSRYIFHTVGPIVYGSVTGQNRHDLANCYLSCLNERYSAKAGCKPLLL